MERQKFTAAGDAEESSDEVGALANPNGKEDLRGGGRAESVDRGLPARAARHLGMGTERFSKLFSFSTATERPS